MKAHKTSNPSKKNEYFVLDVDKILDKISRYSKIDDIYTKIGLLCPKTGC